MKKVKRYDSGGGVREGQNENIDDDTRARAMRFVQQQQEFAAAEPEGDKVEQFKPVPKAVPKVASSPSRSMAAPKAAPKETVTDTGDESARLAARYKKSAPAYETPYARRNRENRDAGIDFDSMVNKVKKYFSGAADRDQSRILTNLKSTKTNEDKFMGGYAKGGKVSSASSRADGIAVKGKTRGRMC